jgi:hypothetical protein
MTVPSESQPRLRIARVAPLYESVPPKLYEGTERVVSWLTEELVEMGHDATLFASGDSNTSARLAAVCPTSLWRDPNVRETLPQHVRMLELVFSDLSRFDVIHFHEGAGTFLWLPARGWRGPSALSGGVRSSIVGGWFRFPVIAVCLGAQNRWS